MVVLVTGARSGFGRLAALEAARRGHIVYAGVRDPAHADDLKKDAQGDLRPIQLEVTRAEDRESAVARILDEQGGRIDALVNNAGVTLGGFLETVDEDEIRKLFDVNVFAPWALTKLVLPAMRSQRSGTIVNISSMSGRMAAPGLGAYASSKFALEALSEAWRHELRPFGIRVVSIEPGAYKTEMLGRNRTLARRAKDAGPYFDLATRMDALAERIQKGAGDPQLVANRIVGVIEAARPGFRYPMGGPGVWIRVMLLRFAPFMVFEQIFARTLGKA
jgi:NAD(P)-dependent dehydrogenase (short-subunit alcohol dehydrogenase family)